MNTYTRTSQSRLCSVCDSVAFSTFSRFYLHETQTNTTRTLLFSICFHTLLPKRFKACSHYSRRHPISKSPPVCLYDALCRCTNICVFVWGRTRYFYLFIVSWFSTFLSTYTLLWNLVRQLNLWRIKWYITFNRIFFYTFQ